MFARTRVKSRMPVLNVAQLLQQFAISRGIVAFTETTSRLHVGCATKDSGGQTMPKCTRPGVVGNASRSEKNVLSFLESTGLDFQREVTVWLDRARRHYARVDFVVPFDDRLVYVEVDEHPHAEYDQRRD